MLNGLSSKKTQELQYCMGAELVEVMTVKMYQIQFMSIANVTQT
jgi:hypothetical protein